MKKLGLFVAIIALAAAITWAGRGQSFDLEGLRRAMGQLQVWHQDHAMAMAALFFAAYVTVTALSLPFAVWMTLAAGALFGFWLGLLLVSIAATLGATLAFLTARYLLRDVVRQKFAAQMAVVDAGMARDGALYLFTLRLIPAMPFFVVNLVMGLTRIPTRAYVIASFLGMLAGTMVFVNAGTQLATLSEISDILSFNILMSFAVLAMFPWLARMVLATINRRKAYRGFARPRRFDRNLIVIGAGAAGLVSAYIAAATRAKVTLIEAQHMGGDCLNTGCVPSKALIKSAKLAKDMRRARQFGLGDHDPKINFAAVMARVHEVIATIAPADSAARYTGLGVEVVQGYGRLIDPWTVEITRTGGEAQRLTSRAIIIATGAAPVVPPLSGLADVGYLTSDTMWGRLKDRETVPQRMVVLGGGPIGCELAQSFARLGSQVTQIEMSPRLMMREDSDAAAYIEAALRADGVQVLTGHQAIACGVTKGAKWIDVSSAGVTRRIDFDEIIVAVGRAPRLTGFGLEELGIQTGRVVETNAYLETLFPHILAAGDVAGPYQFTHTASHQAWYATFNALFGSLWRIKADYRVIPWATFTDPELARVGLSEDEARAAGIPVEVTRYDLGHLDRAIADGANSGFVKVLTAPHRDQILGATIVGPHAGDLIAEFVLAMKHGLGLRKILGTIHIYPTLAEATKFAAGNWRRAHINPRLVSWAARWHTWRRG